MKSYLKLLPLLIIGITQASPYTQKYDSTFGMGLKGVYGWATEDMIPDVAGAMLDWHANIETGDIAHEVSFNFGYLDSPSKYNGNHIYSESERSQLKGFLPYIYAPETWDTTAGIEMSNRLQSVPLLVGYTINFPIKEESVYLYLGAKAGVTYNSLETKARVYVEGKERRTNSPVNYSREASFTSESWDFTYTFTAGIRIALSKSVDAVIGYELFKMNGIAPFHAIEAGLSWTF